MYSNNTMKSRFFEPPRETKIGLKKHRIVREIGVRLDFFFAIFFAPRGDEGQES